MTADLIQLYANANIRVAELERENAALREQVEELDAKWKMAEDQCFDQVGKIGELERDLAWYVREFERLDDRNEALEVENARLQMELDASCNAEELRQVRAENAQLRKTLADTTHL